MGNIESSLLNIGYLETLSYQQTPLHRLDPRGKLLTTLVFIVAVVSFGKYAITGLLPFIIYPVVLVAVGNLPPGYLAKKILLAAPFAFFIGIFNPLLDRAVLVHLGTIGISGDWVSFASIMIRFTLTVSAAFILIAGTGLNAVCLALNNCIKKGEAIKPNPLKLLARLGGFEPPTDGLEVSTPELHNLLNLLQHSEKA
jgi:cobalt/nickel transport system permease protein